MTTVLLSQHSSKCFERVVDIMVENVGHVCLGKAALNRFFYCRTISRTLISTCVLYFYGRETEYASFPKLIFGGGAFYGTSVLWDTFWST